MDLMKKLTPVLALLTVCASVWLTPSSASAVPKMDVKVAVGIGSTTIVPRVPSIDLYSTGPGGPNDNPVYEGSVGGRSRATFTNWGMQLGARITAGKIFGEMAIGFSRFYFEVGDELELIARLQGDPLPEEILNQQARISKRSSSTPTSTSS